jgi:hypothetical protein
MHSPTKLIYEGDSERAALFMGEAHTLLNKARGVADAAGVGMFGKSATLVEGVVAYALYTAQQSVIIINAAPQSVPSAKAVQEARSRPKFYSGVVKGGTLTTASKLDAGEWDFGPPPNVSSYSVLSAYKPTSAWRAQYNAFVDKQNAANKDTPGYTPLTPLGAGYQRLSQLAVDPPEWYDVFPQPTETVIPSQYYKITPSCYSGHMKKLAQYVLGLGRLDVSELAPEDDRTDEVQQSGFVMRYDFRFHSTHGLVKGPDNRWWLVEISQMNGVLAMPLPLYEDYDKDGEEVPAPDLEELTVIKEEFGGQPTGECFPVGTALDDAITRGDVLRLLPAKTIAEFYNYSPYSTCWGWAFSADGHEAHNTAHTIEEFSDSRPIGVGVHYQITFTLSAVNKDRKEGEPVGSGSAGFSRISRGYLAQPGAKHGSQIHYPEPLLEGGSVVTYPYIQRRRYTYCDTTMMVFFIDKELQIVKMYFNPASLPAHIDGAMPEGECGHISGTYQWTEYSSGGHIPPQYYTNDYDFREKIAPSIVVNSHIGSLGGYSGPQVSDHPDNVRLSSIVRQRSYSTKSHRVYRNSSAYRTHIAAPYGAREAYVFAHFSRAEQQWEFNGATRGALTDPNYGTGYRYFYKPHPKPDDCFDEHVRKVQSTGYSGGGCSFLADSGTWLSICQAVSPSPGLSTYGTQSFTSPKFVSHGEGYLVANTDFRVRKLNTPASDAERWETKSPDEFGLVKHFDCVFSALGVQHAVFNQRIGTAPNEYQTYGYLHTEGDRGFFSYLGVL